jgi:uncharacterized protein YjbJ (UPF0337 family)
MNFKDQSEGKTQQAYGKLNNKITCHLEGLIAKPVDHD